MKYKLFFIIQIAVASIVCSCNSPMQKKNEAQPIEKQKIYSALEIVAKFDSTQFRKDKLAKGITTYNDTSYNNQVFIVNDTITDIRVDNAGLNFIILGKVYGDSGNKENMKCYFANDSDVRKLSVGQIITLKSKKHAAFVKHYDIDDMHIQTTIIQLQSCELVSSGAPSINYEIIRTDNRDPIITVDVFIADTNTIKHANPILSNRYNPKGDKFLDIWYYDDKAVAAIYRDKITKENVSEMEKNRLYKHRLAIYRTNPSTGYNVLNIENPNEKE